MDIQFVTHANINFEKWDKAIRDSVNGLVYATSWNLNIVNPNWAALIYGDYDIVMPLTFRSKYGIKYIYKPFFSQFLGVFYKNQEDKIHVKPFLDEATKYFKFITLNLNVSNSEFEANYSSSMMTQVLNLKKDYDVLKSNYNRSNLKNISKANNIDLSIKKSIETKDFISLVKLMYKKRNVVGVTKKDFNDLERIINYSLQNELGEIYYAYTNEKLCASAYFLKWGNRVIVQTAINDLGKDIRAIFKIIDDFIKRNAGQDLIFDFAGSNIPGVQYRNLGFGAQNDIYYRVKINNLPIPLKWIKR